MTHEEALTFIHTALEKTLDKAIVITPDTDLFQEKILDSLDAMLFFLNLTELSGATITEEQMESGGLGKVSALIAHLIHGG